MRFFGWIGQNFVKSVGSVTTSQNTSLCGTFREYFGSVKCGDIRLQRTQSTSGRTGTKSRKSPTLQEEPSWYSPHCGHEDEMRKSWKHVPLNSAGPSYLSPGIVQWTLMGFWVSFGSGRHLQTSGVTKQTTALAQTLPWLDDDELHQLHAVVSAAWREQAQSRWPVEALMECQRRIAYLLGVLLALRRMDSEE